jgi:hypothetical protein
VLVEGIVQDVSEASGSDSVVYGLLDIELWTISLVWLLCSSTGDCLLTSETSAGNVLGRDSTRPVARVRQKVTARRMVNM